MLQNFRAYNTALPKLDKTVMVDDSSVIIGNVLLSEDVSVWPMVVIRGDVNKVTIGKRSNIQDGSVLHVTHKSPTKPDGYPLLIGEDVTIGHKAMLHGCTIGNRVLIGMGSVILDGVTIEDDVMVGAGSLVPPGKTLKSGFLYLGNPARQSRKLTECEISNLISSACNYVGLKNEYLTQITPAHRI